MSTEVPDPLPLRSIPVPLDVTQVEGCDCGGMDLHRASDQWGSAPCSIWDRPATERNAAVADAQDRLKTFTDALNAKLAAALPAERISHF